MLWKVLSIVVVSTLFGVKKNPKNKQTYVSALVKLVISWVSTAIRENQGIREKSPGILLSGQFQAKIKEKIPKKMTENTRNSGKNVTN